MNKEGETKPLQSYEDNVNVFVAFPSQLETSFPIRHPMLKGSRLKGNHQRGNSKEMVTLILLKVLRLLFLTPRSQTYFVFSKYLSVVLYLSRL